MSKVAIEENKISKTLFSPFSLAVMILILFYLLSVLFLSKTAAARIDFFDVGQGDAALISIDSQRILIDGGPDNNVITRLDEVMPFYERSIDGIILTHPHADHLVGLIDVIKKYEVKNFYFTGVVHTTPEYLDFLKILREKKINTKTVKDGDFLELEQGAKLLFLFPVNNVFGQKVENLNNTSIVTKFVYKNKSAIFLGDLESEAQNLLLKESSLLDSDILKVAHHGSKDSVNSNVLDKISPKYSIISVGKNNKFGHPSSTAINTLRGSQIFRTDQDGTVSFRLNENGIFPLN